MINNDNYRPLITTIRQELFYNFSIMKEKVQNGSIEIQSRREFFKAAAKKTLPLSVLWDLQDYC